MTGWELLWRQRITILWEDSSSDSWGTVLPEEGDEVCTEDGIRLVVEKLDKNRVESIHVYLPEKTDDVTEAEKEKSISPEKSSEHTDSEGNG